MERLIKMSLRNRRYNSGSQYSSYLGEASDPQSFTKAIEQISSKYKKLYITNISRQNGMEYANIFDSKGNILGYIRRDSTGNWWVMRSGKSWIALDYGAELDKELRNLSKGVF
jgi:hypothetical protein